jgi:hypothetical protein
MDTFSLDLAGGVIATVGLWRAALQFGDQWPADIQVHLGVGWEPALGLMPLVTLPVYAELVAHSGSRGAFTATVVDSRGVQSTADEITTCVGEHALAVSGELYRTSDGVDILQVAAPEPTGPAYSAGKTG